MQLVERAAFWAARTTGAPAVKYSGRATSRIATPGRLPGMETIALARPAHPRALLAVLLAAPFLSQVDATIANVATPAIRAGLSTSGAAAELVIGGYLIAYAMLLVTGARLGQTHGYKRLFLTGVAIFAVTSLAGGLAPDAWALIAARVAQGAGAAMMFPQAMTGIQLNFAGAARGRAIGLYAIALSAGAVIGQIAGGMLISADIAGTGWRAIFLVNLPVCAAVTAAAIRWLPADPRRGAASLDLAGTALLSASVLLVVLPLTLGPDLRWPAWTWLCLAAAGPALWLFLQAQRNTAAAGRAALVNTAAISRPPVMLGLTSLAVTTATYFALLFTLALYFQQGLSRSPLASGLILVPWVTAFGLAGQATSRLPARLAPVLPATGSLLLAASYLALGITQLTGHRGNLLLVALLAVGGLGLGTQFTTLINHMMGAVPARYAPDISGVTSTTTQVGGAVGVAAFGGLYLTLAGQPGPGQASHSFALTTLAFAAMAMVAAVTAFLATRTAQDTGPAAAPALPALARRPA
jgi:MFS family permease